MAITILDQNDKAELQKEIDSIRESVENGGGGGAGTGLTDEQAAALDANTEARHIHDNKDVLDDLSAGYDNVAQGHRLNYKGLAVPMMTDALCHNQHHNRDYPDQHPISAITNLQSELDNRRKSGEMIPASDISYSNEVYTGATNVKEALDVLEESLSEVSQDIADETTARENAIADLKAQGVQQTPVFVDSIEECADTSKMYVLPDGYIYAYMKEEAQTLTADDFVAAEVQSDGSLPSTTSGGSRIATKNLLSLSDKISVSCPTPYQYFVYYFTGETEDTFIGKTAWKSGNIDDVSTDVVGSGTKEGAKYCRISLRDSTDTSVGLINRIAEFMENITITQGSATGKAWANTGHAFVPADYEDRIIALEEALEGIEYGSY